MIYEVTSQLRSRLNADQGIFIAESPKVIRVALQAGYEPEAMLCEKKHIEGDAATIIQEHPDMPVYTGTRELLSELTYVRKSTLKAMQPLSSRSILTCLSIQEHANCCQNSLVIL